VCNFNLEFFSLLSFSFSFEKEKGKKVTKESKKKDRGRSVRHTFIGTNNACANISKKCSYTLAFSGCFSSKSSKVHNASRKNGLKSQADLSVRKADSAGRLDRDVRSNKAMGFGFQRKGVEPQPPLSFGCPFGSFPTKRKGT